MGYNPTLSFLYVLFGLEIHQNIRILKLRREFLGLSDGGARDTTSLPLMMLLL